MSLAFRRKEKKIKAFPLLAPPSYQLLHHNHEVIFSQPFLDMRPLVIIMWPTLKYIPKCMACRRAPILASLILFLLELQKTPWEDRRPWNEGELRDNSISSSPWVRVYCIQADALNVKRAEEHRLGKQIPALHLLVSLCLCCLICQVIKIAVISCACH